MNVKDIAALAEIVRKNELTKLEIDGELVEICVGNGQVVEYDQPLFRIV